MPNSNIKLKIQAYDLGHAQDADSKAPLARYIAGVARGYVVSLHFLSFYCLVIRELNIHPSPSSPCEYMS